MPTIHRPTRPPLLHSGRTAAFTLGLLFPALPQAAAATAPTPSELVLPQLSSPIVVDGNPGEEAWGQAVAVDRFFEIVPGDNVEPPVRTLGLLGYDSEFLYVGVHCQDPEPSKIRAPYAERDHVADQDLVQIDLDARDEGRWSMIFRINPRGVQADGIFDEAIGQDDFSPDFHFESAARITSEGWSAEMKIPLSTLRYRARDPQTWRITFFRLYPREFRRQIASAPIPRGSNCWLCHATRFTSITGLPRGASVAVTPFVTGSASRDAGGEPSTQQSATAGADLKWLPHPNLAVDAALNPDFSQVESDVPQIGVNTRFALFYPEKRPFFLEGSDLWNSPLPVVYTRTITDADWGARLTGRPGRSSYTLLAARDQGGGSMVLPGPAFSSSAPQPEDAFVFLGRYRYSFGRSSLGTLATLRDAQGYFNGVAGVDFQWYPTDADQTRGQLLWSATSDPGSDGTASAHALLLGWDRSLRHLGWSLELQDLAREFRADSGFVPQTGVRHVKASAGYSFYPQGRLRQLRPQVAFDDVRAPGGPQVSQSVALGLAVDGSVRAALEWRPRDVARARDGRLFEQNYWTGEARVLPSRRFPYLKLSARRGDELDIEGSRLGTGTSLALQATVSPIDRLQAELSGERRWLDVPEAAAQIRVFSASVARAKVTCSLTSRSFVRLVGEWAGLDEPETGAEPEQSFSGSALYGYQLNWQSILYLGYGNSSASTGAAPHGRHQELFIKIAYAFRP